MNDSLSYLCEIKLEETLIGDLFINNHDEMFEVVTVDGDEILLRRIEERKK